MITIYEFTEATFTADAPLFLACGIFDGVHRGHQMLLTQTIKLAQKNHGYAVALTIHPHPRSILTPTNAPAMLSTPSMRNNLFTTLGLDGSVLINFTRQFSELAPEEFFALLLRKLPRLRGLVVGADWRFARQQSGDVTCLKKLTAEKKLELLVVDPVFYADEKISSTRIRNALKNGDFVNAEKMLGRKFFLRGAVIGGRQIARRLGFPTANLSFNGISPLPNGSYLAQTTFKGKNYLSTAYIGTRPTYQANDGSYVVEVFILDADFNLYGQEIDVHFWQKLRDETKFADENALRQAIANDVEKTRQFASLE